MRILFLYWAFLICTVSTAQFTVIPTGTSALLNDLALHGDTLVISGYPDYFAKYSIDQDNLIPLDCPGPVGYVNIGLQVVQDNYYILSLQGVPYQNNYIFKSVDFGNSWVLLADLPGLYYTMTIIDTTFGIIGGGFGSNAITDGTDDNWILQDSLLGTITSSTFYGDSTILMAGASSQFHITKDRGQTWSPLMGSPVSTRQIQFLNSDTIFVLSNLDNSSYLRATINEGSNWSILDFSYDHEQNSGCAFDSEAFAMQMNLDGTGYVLAYIDKTVYDWTVSTIDKMAIFVTNDYGETWDLFVTSFSEQMRDIIFINDSTAFISGENGMLLKWDLTIPLSDFLDVNEEGKDLDLLSAFPNPVTHTWTLVVNEQLFNETLTIYNQLGLVVHTEIISNSETVFDCGDFQNGIYYYSLGNFKGQFSVVK